MNSLYSNTTGIRNFGWWLIEACLTIVWRRVLSLTNVRRNRPAVAGAHSPGGGNAMAHWFRPIEATHHSIWMLVSLADLQLVVDPRKDRWFAFTPDR